MTLRRQSFQSFRLRIPWPFSSVGRSSTEPLRPKERSKSPTHPDTTVPIQRAPSPPKPPVITPVEFPPSPPKTKETPRVEPQKESPAHPTQPTTTSVVIESSVPSQSTTSTPFHSPLRSLEPSSRAGSPFQFSIVSSSPKTPPKSPSHLASNGIIEVAKPASVESTWPTSSAFEQEKEKKVVSESIPQEAEPKVSSPSKTITESPETSFPPERVSIQPQDSEQQASSVPPTPVSETKPASDQPPPPSSPLAAEHTGEVLKRDAEETTLPASPASQEEKEEVVEAVPEPVSQEVESKIKSPLKTIPTSPETSFQHERISTQPQESEQQASPMPQLMVSKTEPTSDQPPLPSSPLASERISEVLKPKSTLPASPASQEEKEKMALAVSEPVRQEAEPKIKSPLKTIPKSPDVERLATPETKKLDLDSAAGSPKTPLETQSKLLESEEKEKEVHEHEPIKARKAKDITPGQPSRHTIASTSRTKTKDPFTRAFHADKKRHGARETVKRKMMFATSKPSEKDIRFVSSADSGTKDVSSISPEKAPLHKGIKDDVSKFVHKIATIDPTQPVDDKQFSVIALAGDNRGATMQVGSESAKEDESVHIHQAYKADPEESTEVTTDVEESTKTGSQSLTKHDAVGKAYVNSNIQSINNSLMVHGSVAETDSGVQVTIPQNPAEPISPHDKRDLETHKVEFNINRDERS